MAFFILWNNNIPLSTPDSGEDQATFVKRAHEALTPEFPETDQRNAVIFDLWRRSRGVDELEKKAHARFRDSDFTHALDVPIFTEHEIVDRDGNQEKYGFEELKGIAERCNHRIADTGNFAVVSKGHTPTKYQQEKGMPQPEVLGFAGPFRLGMIGNKEPKWAIFADEHYFKESAKEMKRLPTRSPEVWLTDEMGDRFMDPIAALGSQTPQLDMGIRFARMESGKEVAKYATLPGGSTTFIPQFGSDDAAMVADKPKEKDCNSSPKLRYEGDEQMALSDGDVAQIVAAFNETAGMRWVASQMEKEQSSVPDETLDPNAAPDEQMPLEPERNEADEDVDDYEASEGVEAGGTGEKVPVRDIKSKAGGPDKYESEEEKPEKGVIPIPDEDKDPKKKREPEMAYAKQARERDQQDRYAKIERQNASLVQRLERIEGEKRQAERYAKLSDLRSMYSFDLEEEINDTADMTDAQFDKHLARVRKYEKIPSDYPMFRPIGEEKPEADAPKNQAQSEAERHEAIRYSAQCADRGKSVSYEDAVQYVRTKHKKVS